MRIPDTLQVGRSTTLARAGNEQITTILIEEFLQTRVGDAIAVCLEAHVGRHLVEFCVSTEVELHAIEELLIVGDVCRLDVGITLSRSLSQLLLADGTLILALCVRVLVVAIETRGSREVKSHARGILNVYAVLINAHRSTFGLCLHIGLIAHSVSVRRMTFVHSVSSVRTLVIVGIQTTRCCASHHEDVVALRLYIWFKLRGKADIEIELVHLVCSVVDGNDMVGIGGNELALIIHSFEVETSSCHGVGNAQVAHIIINASALSLVLESLMNLQVAQWQITFAIHALHFLAEFVGLGVFLLHQCLAHLRQILESIGIHALGNRLARPE